MNEDDLELVNDQHTVKNNKNNQWSLFSKVAVFFVTIILIVISVCLFLYFSRVVETINNIYTVTKTIFTGINIIIDMLSKHNNTLTEF